MKRQNRSVKIAVMHAKVRFTEECRSIVLRICNASLVLLASTSLQAFAATPVEVTDFGSNPGNLRMFKYIPDQLPSSAPLIVVMHGCRQNARTFANEIGWIHLADKLRLALAMPEQTQANNPSNCFNWFQPNNITRDQGEAMSIKQMVDKMKSDHNVDPKRIYATGLSAGGAMTSVMLATYPEVFAGGGIVAGLPYGCAKNLPDALQCMSTGHPSVSPVVGLPTGPTPGPSGPTINVPLPPGFCLFFPLLCPSAGGHTFTPSDWGTFVRQASNHTGPFPKVSIWHGSADTTVSPINSTEEMQQWTNVHGIDPMTAVHDTVKGFPHQTFKDSSGNAVVEVYSVTGMSHGAPVDPGVEADQCGTTDQFIINAHICSGFFMAKFWGLVVN
jgi:poly(hydroxyalkanoate) depolymerase family esterase